ncbi:MAG: CPXCG motif-containing cysteine-rich protein [Granulosicoccus sp.]
MELLKSAVIACPYCGENIQLEIDCSVDFQHYIEDCQVCCRPMNVLVTVDESGQANVVVRHEDES